MSARSAASGQTTAQPRAGGEGHARGAEDDERHAERVEGEVHRSPHVQRSVGQVAADPERQQTGESDEKAQERSRPRQAQPECRSRHEQPVPGLAEQSKARCSATASGVRHCLGASKRRSTPSTVMASSTRASMLNSKQPRRPRAVPPHRNGERTQCVTLGGCQRATGRFGQIRRGHLGTVAVNARRRLGLGQVVGLQIDGEAVGAAHGATQKVGNGFGERWIIHGRGGSSSKAAGK